MARYIYKAMNAEGKKINGNIDADNYEDFSIELKRQGLYLINYSIVREGYSQSSNGTIPLKELSVICRQFSAMLNAGIGVVKCLDILCEQTTNKKTRSKLLAVLEDVRKGTSLHKAMANQGKAFPFYLISSVESGEEGGTLDDVMIKMSSYFEKQYKTKRQVNGAMIYPIILAVLCVIVVTIMLVFVIPSFLSMYTSQGVELPLPTKILISITDFVLYKWWIILLVAGAFAGTVMLLKKLPSTKISWDKFTLNIPVFGKLRRVLATSKFAHTLATLSASGISMLVSLEVVARVVNNAYITQCVSIIIDDLKRGVTLSNSLKKFEVFPTMFKSMIAVGEESGELDALMEKTAAFYEEESDAAVKKMVALVEPMMIVFMALIIAFIVIAVILPIYTLYQNML